MIFEEKRVNGKLIYEGSILNVRVDTVTAPKGHAHREIVEHNGAAAAIAVTDDGKVVMVRQFRYAMGRVVLEVPAGKIDPGEDDPQKTMVRELKEETGYVASKVRSLGRINPSVGYSEELIYLYLMEGLSLGDQQLDDDEALEVELIPYDDLYKMAQNGEIEDAKSIAAIFMAGRYLRD